MSRRAVALIAVLAALAVPAGTRAAGLTAAFSKSSDWKSGFVADYTIKNTGTTTINGWRLEFDLPTGETITGAWNGRARHPARAGPGAGPRCRPQPSLLGLGGGRVQGS